MLDAAGAVLEVSVENEVRIACNLSVCGKQECSSVEVEISAAIVLVGIPTKTNDDFAQTGIAFGKINFLSFR